MSVSTRGSGSSNLDQFEGYLGTFGELNRSLSMSLIITELMIFSSILIIMLSTDETIVNILAIDEQYKDELGKFPLSVYQIIMTSLVVLIIVFSLGLYGYSRLKLHLLAFYALAMVLMIVWYISFVIIVVGYKVGENEFLIHMYKNYFKTRRFEFAADAIHYRFKCCGSKYHNMTSAKNFYQHKWFPVGCCPRPETFHTFEYCIPEKSYTRLCTAHQLNLHTALEEMKMDWVVFQVGAACTGALLFQIVLTFLTIHRVRAYFQELALERQMK